VTPLGEADVALPPCARSGLELVNDLRARRARYDEAARPFVEAARALLGSAEG
jgi:hypothetical protein